MLRNPECAATPGGGAGGQEFKASLDYLDFEATWLCVKLFKKTKGKSFSLKFLLSGSYLWVGAHFIAWENKT